MENLMRCPLRASIKIILCAAVLLSLASCGDNKGPTSLLPPSTVYPPVIEAELFSFPSGSTPANFVNAVVHVNKYAGPAISDAVVSINGVTLPYDSYYAHFQGDVAVAPGESVTLSVTAEGKTYSASGTQFTSYPVISAPAPNIVWSTFYNNTIQWSGGAPQTDAFYALRIVDAVDPNVRIWPSGSLQQEVTLGTTSYTLYGQEGVESPLWGDRLVFVGIAQWIPIPDTSPGSGFVICGLNSVPVSFRYELPDAGFGAGVRYPEPAGMDLQLSDTVIGDLNGDGRNDVATFRKFNGTGEILIYLYSQSTGTLTVPLQSIALDFNLNGIAIADVNGDTFADLIVSGNSTTATPAGRLAVFLQDPVSHTLSLHQVYSLSLDNAIAMAAADLNNDGRADVVVVGQDAAGNGIVSFLFQNKSNGTLGPEVLYTNTPVFLYSQVRVADMNNDKRNDVVLQSAGSQIAVIKQDSATPGTFMTPDFYTVNFFAGFEAFGLGDLNGDGRTDLIVVNPENDGYMKMFLQSSDGTLAPPMSLHVSTQAQTEVEIADLNNDGLNDLIFLNSGYSIQVMYQDADHSFGHPLTSYLPTLTYGGTFEYNVMSVGDVTGDGLPDIVASWSDEGIYVLPRVP